MPALRDLEANITPNFKYKEFVRSNIASQYDIKIEPTEQQWQHVEDLTRNILQPLADRFGGLKINSGIRTPELTFAARDLERYKRLRETNPEELKRLIANTRSYHDEGFAADIEPVNPNVPLLDLIVYTYRELDYSQLIAEYFPTGWVHVAYWRGDNGRPKKLLLLKDQEYNYSRVTVDFLIQRYGRK